ncbi:F-box domain protein [Oesophagostomum dentatum]|uniref:F-box domain protein n=1 Tax=Oesophagostomum dentatum TaxID=61180 RepID=A0A0B1TR62_OESDE|nr:F-box domain protein [Oesophagostomum dentatum]
MAAIYDVTRRVAMHNVDEEGIRARMNEEEDGALERKLSTKEHTTIDKLPDKVLQQIFSYLSPYQILQSGQVCKRWRAVACSPLLWKFVSFRPNYGGIQVTIDKLPDKVLQQIFSYLSPYQVCEGYNSFVFRICTSPNAEFCERFRFFNLVKPNYGGIQVTNHDYFLHLIGTQFSELRIVELATDLITPNVLYEMANKCPRLQHLTLDFSTAMQLHDFTDLQSFPSRLRSLTLCLSENIFLEGFLRKVYTFISSVELLHIIGTYEKVEDEEEEVYETVNVFKLKQFLPNLRVVNLWGVRLFSYPSSPMNMWTQYRPTAPIWSAYASIIAPRFVSFYCLRLTGREFNFGTAFREDFQQFLGRARSAKIKHSETLCSQNTRSC